MKKRLSFLLIAFWLFSGFLMSQTVHEYYQDGLVVFQLKQNAKPILSENRVVDFKKYPLFTEFLADFEIEEVLQLHPNSTDRLLNKTYQIRLSNIFEMDNATKKLESHPSIEYAELKELHYTTLTPNDPNFTTNNQWHLFQIESENAWGISTGNANVVVAVTDNAINVDHPDLVNKMVAGRDVAENDSDPRPCGGNDGFHGSHVSGIVGAETDNNLGVASIGWNVSIMPVKIGRCSDGALIAGYEGIEWAANNGADVINMSWGGGGSSQYGQNICNYAWNQGCILIAAAGNNNQSTQFYPAAYNNVVAVASTNQNDQKSSFSQYGSWIDISAPGSSILSTNQGTGYQTTSGTSMASPLVAGLVGLMKSHALNATNTDIINCLYSGADNIDAQNSGYIGQLGAGRINAHNSMVCASGFSAQIDAAITAVITPVSNICSNNFTPEVELRNYGSNTLTSVTISYEWNGNLQTYNWSGSLLTGQTEIVTLAPQTAPDGAYTFTAYTSSPNGVADQNPSNDQSQVNFSVAGSGQVVDLQLVLDCYGSEITWEITDDSNGNVIHSGGGYANVAGGTTVNESLCLAVGCYTFTINDSYGDGMYGSQWNNCSVDGDYTITDPNSNVLVQMTAPNADFGTTASHQFCITQPNNMNDAGISEIISPQGIFCGSSVQPEVRLRNYGNDPLTSVTINYQTNGPVQTYNWTGNLSSNQTEIVTLPAISVGNGNITLQVYTSSPNGLTDNTPSNDDESATITVHTNTVSLPFTETFETDVFASGDWSRDNPDNSVTWERVSVGGITPGSTAAKIDFYNYQQASRRDGLISPRISLAGYTSADLTFDHAYRRYDQTAADSLIIYISTDCGMTYQRVLQVAEDGTGSFATQTTNTNAFTPSIADDWCFSGNIGASCFTVNLDTYVGQEIIVKFESFNAGTTGNNLFLDNINIDGVPANDPPIPNFSTDNNTICEGGTVNFTDQSTANITGWNWTFPGGSPATSTAQNPTVTYATAGTYDVTLEVTNSFGTESITMTNEITVNAQPTVSVSATDIAICEGSSTQLMANGANTYTWDNGLGSGANKTVSPTVTTTYIVTGSNGAGCEDVQSITITVDPAPSVTASATQSTICLGQSADISASGADSYTWDNGLGAGSTHTVSPTATTIYTVTGETAAAGCTNTATVVITVEDVPVLNVTASSTEICRGESVTLSANGANTYSWSPGTGLNSITGSVVVATPTSDITYTVEGSNNCGNATETISITVSPVPAAPVISQSGNDLSVTLQPGQTVEWYLNGNLIGTTATITMTTDGQYTAVIINEFDCSASTSGNFEMDYTGLDENAKENSIMLFPNPSEGIVYLDLKGHEEELMVQVNDAVGRLIVSPVKLNVGGTTEIDLTEFEAGMYTFIFTSEHGRFIRKVSIK
ncbi:MAG: S8 family serine peptidase [Brumimicrobium sp.]|nr:S8 family serine peptidase [Brumimicrobium sp.]